MSESDDYSQLHGPKVNTEQVMTLSDITNTAPRGTMGSGFNWRDYQRFLGEQGGNRQLYDALGYTNRLSVGHYVSKYERGPGIVRGIVDKPVHDCWKGEIEIEEADDTDVDETNFEKEVRRLLSGEYTRLPPAARFRAADRWARLLEYSLVLIGVSDDNSTEGNPEALANPVDADSINGLEDLNYLSVFDQRRVDWDATEMVTDPTNPRYNLPETYNVNVGDDVGNIDIHHSRILHVVEEPDENDLKSDSVLKPIYNRLDDIQKLLGGSAEMFWRSAYPGLVLTPPTDADGVPMRFDDGGSDVAEQIQKYRQNLDRLHRVTGNLEKLDTDVASPEDQIGVQIEDISAAVDIPMSIVRGNETGERATQEDRAMYHEYIGGRRTEHCEEQLLRKFIDRLLDWGALPEPNSAEEGVLLTYIVNWPAQEEPTEKELAETAYTWAQAFNELAGGQPQKIASVAERRKWALDMDPEYGSEAPDLNAEELAAENLEVPEEADVPSDDDSEEESDEQDE